jgi:hypothetical protein
MSYSLPWRWQLVLMPFNVDRESSQISNVDPETHEQTSFDFVKSWTFSSKKIHASAFCGDWAIGLQNDRSSQWAFHLLSKFWNCIWWRPLDQIKFTSLVTTLITRLLKARKGFCIQIFLMLCVEKHHDIIVPSFLCSPFYHYYRISFLSFLTVLGPMCS